MPQCPPTPVQRVMLVLNNNLCVRSPSFASIHSRCINLHSIFRPFPGHVVQASISTKTSMSTSRTPLSLGHLLADSGPIAGRSRSKFGRCLQVRKTRCPRTRPRTQPRQCPHSVQRIARPPSHGSRACKPWRLRASAPIQRDPIVVRAHGFRQKRGRTREPSACGCNARDGGARSVSSKTPPSLGARRGWGRCRQGLAWRGGDQWARARRLWPCSMPLTPWTSVYPRRPKFDLVVRS